MRALAVEIALLFLIAFIVDIADLSALRKTAEVQPPEAKPNGPEH